MEYRTISKQTPHFPEYLDFQFLRQIGINRLPELAGKLWTDYNLHDPGITILEVLCYAITDLGYRNNLDIEDLLALKPGASENNFFTPDQILTCNPVTILDIRKRLIDIQGVHNAWLEKVDTYEPTIWIDVANNRLRYTVPPDQKDKFPNLNPRGLYTVYLDLDPDYHKNACGQLERSWSDVVDEVRQVLCRYRNLCEDLHDIVILDEEEIKLCADIQLETDADGEDVLVEIYGRIQDFLVPQIHFYTLQQLLEKDQSTAEIFAGRPARDDFCEVYESHGFIDIHELEKLTLPKILHTSDLYQKVLGGADVAAINGVAAIKKLLIASSINGLPQSQESPWYLQLTPQYRPVLSIEGSTIRLFKNGLPVAVNLDEVKRRYYEQRSAYIKAKRDPYELDLPVPQGKFLANLASHYSIHHEFPLTYGIGEDGLSEPVSAQRQAQAKQLKGYLVFFDQLLAKYLAQLAHVRQLFSWEITETQTYFNQPIQFPGSNEILQKNYLALLPFWWKWYRKIQSVQPLRAEAFDLWFVSLAYHVIASYYLSAIAEEEETYRDRRNRFLDHLLARFAESFTDYVLLNYRMFEKHRDKRQHELHLIEEKANFIKNYPVLSRDRFRAFNYCNCKEVWDTDNVSGFKKRVSRLLGIEDVRRRNLNHYKVEPNPGGFTLSIRCGSSTLTSQQVYATESDAQAAMDRNLSFALCSNYYKRLTYKYFYHYGWEVEGIHQGEPVQARYEAYFISQIDHTAALQMLRDLPPLPTQTIALQDQKNNLYYFQLVIRLTSTTSITFTGVQRYFSAQDAKEKASTIVDCIRLPQNYHKILFLTNGDAERETQNPSFETRFTHYGYALMDNEGKLLAESSERFVELQERDAALMSWLSIIRAGECAEVQSIAAQAGNTKSPIPVPPPEQFEFVIQPCAGGYNFVLQDAAGSPVLRSLKADAKAEVWENAYRFAENLFYLNRYVSSTSLVITDDQGEQLAVAETERDRLALFKRLNAVEPFLSIQLVQVETETEPLPRYRCQLSDRTGAILLEGVQLFEDASSARDRFYQDVLGVLFEPGMRYSSTDRDGFGFGVLSRPGDRSSKVAVHPQTYVTKEDRDAAVNRLFSLVRTARMIITINPQKPAHVGRVYGQNGAILLQGQPSANEEMAWAQGNILMELASVEVDLSDQSSPDGKNFRLIDMEDTSVKGVYGWELTNETKDQILATHFCKSQSDRDQAIKALQQQVNDEGFHVLEHILLRPRHPLIASSTSPTNLALLVFWWKWYLKLQSNPSQEPKQFELWFISLVYQLISTRGEDFLPICVNPEEVKPGDGELFAIARRDPYSFWVTIVLPYWSQRFRDIKFRGFVEQTLRLEAPAHIALKVAWVNVRQMNQFEAAYKAWLEQLAQTACEGVACDLVGSLNQLIDILTQLRSVYPKGNLSSYEGSISQKNPIILNQTELGSATSND